MAKAAAGGNVPMSASYKGKARKILQIAEYMAEHPNATSNAINNATGAGADLVSVGRRLIKRATGMNAHFEELPSVSSRGMPRKLFKVLELMGDDPEAAPAQIAADAGVNVGVVNSIKGFVDQAGAEMD